MLHWIRFYGLVSGLFTSFEYVERCDTYLLTWVATRIYVTLPIQCPGEVALNSDIPSLSVAFKASQKCIVEIGSITNVSTALLDDPFIDTCGITMPVLNYYILDWFASCRILALEFQWPSFFRSYYFARWRKCQVANSAYFVTTGSREMEASMRS